MKFSFDQQQTTDEDAGNQQIGINRIPMFGEIILFLHRTSDCFSSANKYEMTGGRNQRFPFYARHRWISLDWMNAADGQHKVCVKRRMAKRGKVFARGSHQIRIDVTSNESEWEWDRQTLDIARRNKSLFNTDLKCVVDCWRTRDSNTHWRWRRARQPRMLNVIPSISELLCCAKLFCVCPCERMHRIEDDLQQFLPLTHTRRRVSSSILLLLLQFYFSCAIFSFPFIYFVFVLWVGRRRRREHLAFRLRCDWMNALAMDEQSMQFVYVRTWKVRRAGVHSHRRSFYQEGCNDIRTRTHGFDRHILSVHRTLSTYVVRMHWEWGTNERIRILTTIPFHVYANAFRQYYFYFLLCQHTLPSGGVEAQTVQV